MQYLYDMITLLLLLLLLLLKYEGIEGICLPQDRDQWRSIVNTAMNACVPQNARNLLGS
jgi:hypothetical protein